MEINFFSENGGSVKNQYLFASFSTPLVNSCVQHHNGRVC